MESLFSVDAIVELTLKIGKIRSMKITQYATRHLGMSDTCSNAAYIRPR